MKKKKATDGITRLLNIGSGFVSACAGLLAVVLILYSGYVLYDSLSMEASAFSSNGDLLKYKPSVMAKAEDEPSLEEINPDYRAWITVDGTPIDYPIVQGKDDLYYASHDVYKEPSLTGAIYLAAGNKEDFSDSYNLLYGHHMDNGAMFGSLDKYKDRDYFSAHQTATLITKDGKTYDVTFFAVVSTDAYEDEIYTVGNRAKEVISFLTGNRSQTTEVLTYHEGTAKGTVKILALSTCASAYTNGRLVLFGRMTEREEPTPTPEPTVTPTATVTDEPTATPGETDAPTDTPAPTDEQTDTPGPTDEPTETPEETDTPTPKPTRTATPTITPTPTGEPKPTATPTPDKGKRVKLTVKYELDNEEVFPDVIVIYNPGDDYYVVTPQYPGYDVDFEIVEGTIWEDTIVIVHFTPRVYHLTIRYIYPDGTQAADTYETEIRTGDAYDVASPEIPGYKPMRLNISGINPGIDEEYTVIYVPEDYIEIIDMDDYDTPLNPGYSDLQIGVCLE